MIKRAIEVAVRAHEGQVRKGTQTPYIVHPLSVGIILAKAGAPDEVIIAGILHDTIEDTPVTFEQIGETFGETIANLVKGASESDKSLPWEERKQHTIDSLAFASIEVLLVICADEGKTVSILVLFLYCQGFGEKASHIKVPTSCRRSEERDPEIVRGQARVTDVSRSGDCACEGVEIQEYFRLLVPSEGRNSQALKKTGYDGFQTESSSLRYHEGAHFGPCK